MKRLSARLLSLGLVLQLVAPAAADPRKILVLPVEGTADAATRAKLTAQVARLARMLDGRVTTGDATFADTALAVGCEPRAASCRDEVLTTLAVDELVWATATKEGAQTRLVVRRAVQGAPPRELGATISASDPAERVDTTLTPLFEPPVATPAPALPPPSPRAAPVKLAATTEHRDRGTGLVILVGGGVALSLGLALLGSYASLQRSINDHPTSTRDDFDDLRDLEDRASKRAIAGDLLVVAGLVTVGIGAYHLVRQNRLRRRGVAIAPVPLAQGAGLTLTLVGGL